MRPPMTIEIYFIGINLKNITRDTVEGSRYKKAGTVIGAAPTRLVTTEAA